MKAKKTITHRTHDNHGRRLIKKSPAASCTQCGQHQAVTNLHCPWYKSVKVRIQLCASCAKEVLVQLLCVTIDGRQSEMLVDRMTKYGQI